MPPLRMYNHPAADLEVNKNVLSISPTTSFGTPPHPLRDSRRFKYIGKPPTAKQQLPHDFKEFLWECPRFALKY